MKNLFIKISASTIDFNSKMAGHPFWSKTWTLRVHSSK
jgi:hypothetical protein